MHTSKGPMPTILAHQAHQDHATWCRIMPPRSSTMGSQGQVGQNEVAAQGGGYMCRWSAGGLLQAAGDDGAGLTRRPSRRGRPRRQSPAFIAVLGPDGEVHLGGERGKALSSQWLVQDLDSSPGMHSRWRERGGRTFAGERGIHCNETSIVDNSLASKSWSVHSKARRRRDMAGQGHQ